MTEALIQMDQRTEAGEPPRLAKTREVASFLRCSQPCVREMISSGRLHAVKVGRGYRITREAVLAFLAVEGARGVDGTGANDEG